MARYSPGSRPSRTAEKPSTGCEGSGKVIPLVVPASASPEAGPGARVYTGRTARPSSVGPGLSATAGNARNERTAPKPSLFALTRFMRVIAIPPSGRVVPRLRQVLKETQGFSRVCQRVEPIGASRRQAYSRAGRRPVGVERDADEGGEDRSAVVHGVRDRADGRNYADRSRAGRSAVGGRAPRRQGHPPRVRRGAQEPRGGHARGSRDRARPVRRLGVRDRVGQGDRRL